MKLLTVLWLLYISVSVRGQLTVTSLPAVLFNGMNQSIAKGSVIWLYCEVNSVSPFLTVTWNKDNVPLEQDVPHIRVRSSSNTSSSTFLLVVDNFQSSDDGTYQCIAEDGAMRGNGASLTLTATTSLLRIITNDAAITEMTDIPPDNRTGYSIGDNATLNFVIGRVNDSTIFYTAPRVLWLKDGAPARTEPKNRPKNRNGRISTTLHFSFWESDVGVYQCVITDSNSELLATIPIRLDSDETLMMSPATIILTPPEKLVLEVRAMDDIGSLIGEEMGNPFYPEEHSNQKFLKTFPTFLKSMCVNKPPQMTGNIRGGLSRISRAASSIEFIVISSDYPNTTIVSSSVIKVVERESVNISCTSTGIPVPGIMIWKLDNIVTSFNQTDIITDFEVNVTRRNSVLVPEVISGNIVSTLHIENVQYPTHYSGTSEERTIWDQAPLFTFQRLFAFRGCPFLSCYCSQL